jgi:hypothetical protein
MTDEPSRQPLEIEVAEADPGKVIPLEAARAHLAHWWREPMTGVIALGIGVYDSWIYGHEKGLSSSLDEILVLGGIVLMAGSRRLFAGAPSLIKPAKEKETKTE